MTAAVIVLAGAAAAGWLAPVADTGAATTDETVVRRYGPMERAALLGEIERMTNAFQEELDALGGGSLFRRDRVVSHFDALAAARGERQAYARLVVRARLLDRKSTSSEQRLSRAAREGDLETIARLLFALGPRFPPP